MEQLVLLEEMKDEMIKEELPDGYSYEDIRIDYRDKEPTFMDRIQVYKELSKDRMMPINQMRRMTLEYTADPEDSMYLQTNIRRSIEGYLDEELGDDYFYVQFYEDILKLPEVTVPTHYNYREKLIHMKVDILNHVFKPLPKKFEDGYFSVKLAERYIENYTYFANNRVYLKTLDEKKELFDLINYYFRGILFKGKNNFSPVSIFNHTPLSKNVRLEGDKLSVRVTAFTDDETTETGRYFTIAESMDFYKAGYQEFGGAAVKIVDFLAICELIALYRKDLQEPDISREQVEFQRLIENRRVPIESVSHKTAQKEARKRGLTHFFLPLNEEAIPAGTPFTLKLDLNQDVRIRNIWTLHPPIPEGNVIRRYVGNNHDYPAETTREEPHLLGEELLRGKFSNRFYMDLVEHYDWEHKEEAEQTLQLIEKYPRLGNDLIRIGKEQEIND